MKRTKNLNILLGIFLSLKAILNIKAIILLFIFNIVFNLNVSPALALTPAEQQLLNQQLILQQQQEQRRQQEQNQLQIDDAENIRRTRVGADGIESIDGNNGENTIGGGNRDNSSGGDMNCIRFNRIELIGNNIYSTEYLNRKVLNKYINSCINKKNIDDITNSLMKIYVDRPKFWKWSSANHESEIVCDKLF